jgi:hypothetical protein
MIKRERGANIYKARARSPACGECASFASSKNKYSDFWRASESRATGCALRNFYYTVGRLLQSAVQITPHPRVDGMSIYYRTVPELSDSSLAPRQELKISCLSLSGPSILFWDGTPCGGPLIEGYVMRRLARLARRNEGDLHARSNVLCGEHTQASA